MAAMEVDSGVPASEPEKSSSQPRPLGNLQRLLPGQWANLVHTPESLYEPVHSALDPRYSFLPLLISKRPGKQVAKDGIVEFVSLEPTPIGSAAKELVVEKDPAVPIEDADAV